MLVYLASYPRSGNLWSQNLIRYYFGHLTFFSIYVGNHREYLIKQVEGNATDAASNEGPSFLTPALRQTIAEQDSCTFIKTHELPFDHYFTGERVIHIVRHPGAALWSYNLFLRDIDHAPVSIEGLIRGDYGFNHWSTHTECWSALDQTLGDQYLRYAFEQLRPEESMICQAISKLTGLPLCQPLGTFPSIDYWRVFRPNHIRKGTVDEWQEHFTPAECQLLLRCHGETMAKFGYTVDPSLLPTSDEQAAQRNEEDAKAIFVEIPEQGYHQFTPPSVPWHRKFLRPMIRPIYRMMPRQSLMVATLFHKATIALTGSPQPDTILHITHHKAGSQWVAEVLKHCVAPQRLVLPLPKVAHFSRATLRPGGVYLAVYRARSQVEEITGSFTHPIHKFVIIRDLRDTLVSLYFSMRYSHVATGAIKQSRTHLSLLDEEEGLRYLLGDRTLKAPGINLEPDDLSDHKSAEFRPQQAMSRIARLQKSWMGGNDRLLIRYEELVADEYNVFQRMMDYCEVDVDKEYLHHVIYHNSFEARTGRKPGQEDIRVHQRKGIVGDWRNHFTDRVKGLFKERYGDVLIDTGYEENMNW
jgi:lipopolysaccharide transport system ATP-binding protein